MKKSMFKIVLSLLIMSVFFGSCKKDKDEDNNNTTANNYFEVNGVKYILSKGTLENYGKDMDPGDGWDYQGYNIDLVLFSSGLVVTNQGDTMFNVSGKGQAIYFELFTTDSTFLANGDYSYSTSQPFPTGTFDYGDYSINLDADNGTADWIEIKSGTVKISRTGNTYQITINCTDSDGKTITGKFEGTLMYFDYTADTKSKTIKKNRF